MCQVSVITLRVQRQQKTQSKPPFLSIQRQDIVNPHLDDDECVSDDEMQEMVKKKRRATKSKKVNAK